MWNCKHCKQQFEFKTTNEKANHSRWCSSNPKVSVYKEQNRKKAIGQVDRKFGKFMLFDVSCHTCSGSFRVKERQLLFPSKDQYFCSRGCANSVGGKAKSEKYHTDETAHYTTVCFRHHERKCCICTFDKIVQVHHVDHNKKNNDPKNLVPICPNHHQMWHSKFRVDIEQEVLEYINIKWNGEFV